MGDGKNMKDHLRTVALRNRHRKGFERYMRDKGWTEEEIAEMLRIIGGANDKSRDT